MTARRSAVRRFHSIYSLIQNERICVYCGIRATTIDHFVPLSIVAILSDVLDVSSGRFLVPACGECNGLASNKIFPTVAAKRRYIQARLRYKYRRLLAGPHWTEQKLEEMGPLLSSAILAAEVKCRWVEERLQWRNTHNRAAVELAAIRLRLGAFGSNSARTNAGTTGTTKSANG